MRCDVIAQGILDAATNLKLEIPLIVRLQGLLFFVFYLYSILLNVLVGEVMAEELIFCNICKIVF